MDPPVAAAIPCPVGAGGGRRDDRLDVPRQASCPAHHAVDHELVAHDGHEPDVEVGLDRLQRLADSGIRDLAIAIGGADGLTPDLRDRADWLISFGPMVWPHMLARVMLSEQLYRAATILAGGPYHRGDPTR